MTSSDDLEFDSPPGRMITVKMASSAVIGDIHGRADLLERLLAKIPTTRQVLVAGDLCDRVATGRDGDRFHRDHRPPMRPPERCVGRRHA